MANLIDLSFAPVLAPGDYFVAVGLVGAPGLTGPWSNPVVPVRATDNALQRNGGVWVPVRDSQDGPVRDLPFVLEGDRVVPAIPEPSAWALFGLGALALLAWRRRRAA